MTSLRKGVINTVDSNASKMQTVQVEGVAGDVASNVERYQQFGFSTYPVNVNPADGTGAEAIIANLGNSSLSVVLNTDDRRYRPIHGFSGDVITYSTHDVQTATHDTATQRQAFTDDGTANYRYVLKVNNCKFELKSDNTITITNGNGTVVMAPNGNITLTTPTLTINGNTTFNGQVTANGKRIDDTHHHSGVATGAGNTGTVI